MNRIIVTFVLLATASTLFAATARPMYESARARERDVRAALAETAADAQTLRAVREVVSLYEAVVHRYPASGYSDNALWQAARLALDAYTRFGDERDWLTGVRLLRRLAATYPTSKLVKQVPEQLIAAGAEIAAPVPPLTAATTGSVGPAPATPKARATIMSVQRAVFPDAVRVTIELDAEVPFHEERLNDPARVFLDLPATRAAPALLDQTLRFEGDADIIRQVRIGRHPNSTTRVVLDAEGMASYSVYALYNPYRLVVDCVRASTPAVMPAAAPARVSAAPATPVAPPRREVPPPPLRSRRVAVSWGRGLPSPRPLATTMLHSAHAAAALIAAAPATRERESLRSGASDREAAPARGGGAPRDMERVTPPRSTIAPLTPLPTPPAKNLAGGFSMARQLGLHVSRIVIDPGHGGHDPGAKGRGITEAELVLDIAFRLEALLQKIPGVEVILTRRTDEFIALPDRTALANSASADLFLSIHANASPNTQARGVETYFLNFAKNQSAAAVAARENAESAQAMGALPDFIKAIALNNKMDESRDFATQVQRAMLDRLRGANKGVKDLGVKQAPFVVLIGAAMPSVLAEISFVTNLQEARLLRGPAYRQRIADALLTAIRKYQTSLKGVSAVAHQ